MGDLTWPATSECEGIYASRKHDSRKWGDTTPYTVEVYRENKRKQDREIFGLVFIFLAVAVILISILLYAAGTVTAWIIRGFRQSQ